MNKNKNLLAVSQDNLITRIIRNLRKLLSSKQKQEDNIKENRKAEVIGLEKLDIKGNYNITDDVIKKLETNENYVDYIDKLNENELNILNSYYEDKIGEIEDILLNEKSNYYKMISENRRINVR